MTPTTLIMPYYDNPGMLREQFAHIRALPAQLRDLLSVIIVDDGSPNHPAQPEDLAGVALQVYRMGIDVRWNQDACRNIGVEHSEKEWLFLTDIDHMVPEKTWQHLLLRDWDPKTVYTFRRVSAPEMEMYKPHPNTWFMTRKLYKAMGGYDERFAGFYGTDADFRDRLTIIAPVVQLKQHIIRVPRTHIADASTTTYLRKQPEDRTGIANVKAQRAQMKDKRPLTLTFPYERVYP